MSSDKESGEATNRHTCNIKYNSHHLKSPVVEHLLIVKHYMLLIYMHIYIYI